MKTKQCGRCKKTKKLNDFYKKGNSFREICKECSLEDFRKAGVKWAKEHKEEIKIKAKNYRIKNRKKLLIYLKNYKKKNKLLIKKARKKYNQEHKVQNANYIKKYRQNISNHIADNLRSRIYLAIQNNQKSGHTLELLGCSIEELKNHLESQFKPGMNWSNYGKNSTKTFWVIDHILPCCSYDLSQKTAQCDCFHYTNLQPLWNEENLAKIVQDKKMRKVKK